MKAGPTLVDYMGGIHLYGAILTALYDRDRSGEGRLVEVAMQETVYSSLAASFEYYHRTGNPPPRAGNRQAGLSSTPYNVYPTADGHVAIHIVTEGHWKNLLKAMGNTRRLMVLCKLVEHGEMTVGDLAREVDLSQSALSQHLARMREEGLVAFRRESQTLWYRIADPRTEQLLASLYTIFCEE